MREICSKLTINKPDRRHWRRYGAFIINFEQLSHINVNEVSLVFLLLVLNKLHTLFLCFHCWFEQVNVSGEKSIIRVSIIFVLFKNKRPPWKFCQKFVRVQNRISVHPKLSPEKVFRTWGELRQKQPPEVFFEKRCSDKFRKIHRKTAVLASLFKLSCKPRLGT